MSTPLILRVFLSSPGDVAEEREMARQVMDALEGSHLLRGRVRFEIVAWDDEYASAPMDARETPQASVNRYSGRPAECDLTVVIVWSRIGTRLPPGLARLDGSRYESGTVWEYEDALSADKPVFVYRRTSKPQTDLDDPEFERKRGQYAAVKTFFDQFANQDGSLQAGFNPYLQPQDFEQVLRQHLEAFVNERLGNAPASGVQRVSPDDPKVSQILTLIDELARKNQQIDEKEAEIARLREENEQLSRGAIARTLTAAAQPEASDVERAAGAALEVGNTRPAEALLREQERNEADAIAVGAPEEADQRRQAAKLAREQGALAFGHDVRSALAAYQRAAKYEPQDTWTHFFIGDLQLRLGDLSAALESYRQAGTTLDTQVRGTPDDDLQRDLAVSQDRIGDVLVAQGDGAGALTAYSKCLAIAKTLAARDPTNTELQRDLGVSHNKIGNVLMAQGDGPGALAAYRKSLAIRDALAARGPTDTQRQRDLGVSHNKIGNMLVAEGDGPGALTAYRKGLAIAQALAARDPGNTRWQRDLGLSHNKIGNVLVAQGDGLEALAAYRSGLAIREVLAARDPGNTLWQRDLGVSHNKIGDALMAQGDGQGALAAYCKGLAVAEALAARDRGNTVWQRDLGVSHNKIGDVLVAQGDSPGALAAYHKGLVIREVLAARDPTNVQWQKDVAVSCAKLGTLDHGQSVAARCDYMTRGKTILLKLESEGRLTPSQDWTAWFEEQSAQLPPGPP